MNENKKIMKDDYSRMAEEADDMKIEESNEDISTRGSEIFRNNGGIAVIEIVLIIVVAIALVAIFKNQAIALVNKIWKSVTEGSTGITGFGLFKVLNIFKI